MPFALALEGINGQRLKAAMVFWGHRGSGGETVMGTPPGSLVKRQVGGLNASGRKGMGQGNMDKIPPEVGHDNPISSYIPSDPP